MGRITQALRSASGGDGSGASGGIARAGLIAGGTLLVLLPLLVTIPALDGGAPTGAGTSASGQQAEPAAAESPEPSPVAPSPSPLPSPSPAVPIAAPPPVFTCGAWPTVGARGPDVVALEQRLSDLSYMVGKIDGIFDHATRHGVIAFQKVEGLTTSGEADPPTLLRLQSAARPAPGFLGPADHLEVDIKRQVVFVVRGSQVAHTLPTSTGNNKKFTSEGYTRRAVTPNGIFTVEYKRQGWRRSPLGLLYRPAYFNGGIAFHGAKSVPTHAASHGCVRLPMPFADWFAEEASPVGTVVYVYGGPHGENPAPMPPSVADSPAPAPDGEPAAPTGPSPSPSPSPTPAGLLDGLLNPS